MPPLSGNTSAVVDPRALLAHWANENDEWVRYIVRQVLTTGRGLTTAGADHAYALFRQEKSLDPRILDTEQKLAVATTVDEAEEPLSITRLSDVSGVNALSSGAIVEPHAGLTILFGENGTGKTGYSRIFKTLASSRTADTILGDIAAPIPQPQSATVTYQLGNVEKTVTWAGQEGVPPFTRMSIFDSPSVSFHVDDDLDYVYVPAALALFNHVIAGLKTVQKDIEDAVSDLKSGNVTLLSRFPKEASVYPLIETLGASTDLTELQSLADTDTQIEVRIDALRRAVAALEADTIGAQIGTRQRAERVLAQATSASSSLTTFDAAGYNAAISERSTLRNDYKQFRDDLFKTASLPTEPEETWEAFISAGDAYSNHLKKLDVHDSTRCLYCRQPLENTASKLISKYSDYLADKINTDIGNADTRITSLIAPIHTVVTTELDTFIDEYQDRDDKPSFYEGLVSLASTLADLVDVTVEGALADSTASAAAKAKGDELDRALGQTRSELKDLRQQATDREGALRIKKKDLTELLAAAELAKSWDVIDAQVRDAKQADRLGKLAKPIAGLSRAVTGLAKAASDELINQSFDALFLEECEALRAPDLKVEFVGRQGRAQRRKVLTGKHKPSKVLSEGEQKVLAMADFLAEARLAGITAPVIFDDPVSSLDHRRVREVAQRIALLAANNQVIVFTHDILFATTLLSLFETSKRCTYYQITDEEGKGRITRATGPRWDSLNNLKKNINDTVAAAKTQEGEARAALVRTGYDWIRSWCEVFTELELLQGVTQRYQPNVRMTSLSKIKPGALAQAVNTVTRVFEDACRYIDGHSQPLASLSVSPTLTGLEGHWAELQGCRSTYLTAD
jgi:energy-coupling factor transporter ATP-binding protein EcfA2